MAEQEQVHPDEGHPDEGKVRPGGLIATLVVLLVVVVGVGVFFWSETYRPPSTNVAAAGGMTTYQGQPIQQVNLNFNTYPDSTGSVNGVPIHPSGNPGWPAYGPSNIMQVPAHALVNVTVHQYDSGGSLNNPWFAKIRGTVGGTATITSPDGKTSTVTSVDPNNVGHTFTLRGIPGTDPGFFVSVPLPTNANLPNDNNNPDAGQYYTVKFSFISGSKGTYAWNCEFPCGQMIASFGGVMSAYGFMSGFLHVV